MLKPHAYISAQVETTLQVNMPDDLTEAITQSLRIKGIPELDYSTFVREFAIFPNSGRAILTKGRISVDDNGRRERVVLKTINPQFATNTDAERRKKLLQYFEREAGIWRLTSGHPNILHLYGFVTIPGRTFPSLVSPYLEGGDLRAFVENSSYDTLPAKRRMKLTCDIARGISFLHSLSPPVVHRDLKASNALVRYDEEDISAVLIDFGSAKLLDSDVFDILNSTCSSSKAWSPPEYILNPRQYTEPTVQGDIWSLACTCIEIFTAKDPYRGYDVEDALRHGKIPDKPAGISAVLWEFLKGCLDTNPARRPCSERMISALEALIPGS